MRRGPSLMIAATLVLTCMSAAVKVARSELSTLDVVVWRSVFAIPFAWWWARKGALRVRNKTLLSIRIGLGFAAMLCFFTALKGLPLADTNLITKIQPVLIALGAPFLLGKSENIPPQTWALLLAGMLGTAILIAPDLSTGNVWGVWALASSVFSAGAHIALRGLKDERSEAIVFWLQITVFLLALTLILLTRGSVNMPSSRIWLALAGVGIFATTGQLLMTKAYALETAGRVAAVRFVGPIWGIALDVLFFTGWPEFHVWVGGIVIVSAGLLATVKGREKAQR